MGNQLTGIAPSQILPVEHYLQDVSEYEYESNLGSTRFFKVARARYGEGLVVVKVFVIHDPSLPLKIYRDRLGDIARRLANASNVLPFQKETVSDKAAMLFRQYVKDSLYDRISTRPFLSTIEKQFMAFQLLCALNQCHKLDICHGDIKSENVMVTSWNWLLLADFASFKPTYLPEDNPADFSYFFDTSRRRTCYLAPERFVESSWASSDSVRDTGGDDLPTASNIKKGDLTTAMDIFSAGCVITELFTEGKPPFDLSQLLSYRTGEYSPKELIQDIDNVYVRDLVRHMMQKDPKLRFTTEEYMVNQKGKAFPDYFYSFLKTYLQKFAATPIISPDDRVMRIKQDISLILEKMQISKTDLDENTCLVMIISLVTATIRNLHFLISKLTALDIMLELSKYVTSDIVLDRVIPFMLYMVNDSFPQVRADAIRTITLCLSGIKSVPLSDANIFPEYILPQMSHLTQDYVISVRVAYAENIALLSETASRFLEIVQLTTQPLSISPETSQEMSHYKASYDIELQALHDMIQQKVVTLLSDHENIVKQTLLENGITRLCVFFGRQKANDVLLSHMITFLNNKKDWHLRGAFFDAIVGITAYVGWHSSTILKPLLQQGLSDTEEFVINKTLTALQALVEMSLIQKPMKYELLHEVCPFLCHPNTWIRQGAAGFVSAMARTMNIADVHCNLLPVIKPYLKQDILQVEKELMLLHCLSDPIPRTVYDFILRSNNIDRLFKTLEQRQMMRQLARPGHSPNYSELDNTMSTMFRKLQSEGMQREDEDKLYAMRDFMMKLHKSRDSSKNENVCRDGDLAMSGAIDLGSLPVVTKRHADLLKIGDPKADLNLTIKKPQTKRKVHALESPTTLMNEDWKQMFGSSDIDRSTIKARKDLSNLEAVAEGVPSTSSQYRETQYGVQSLSLSVSQLQTSSDKKGKSKEERAPSQSKYASSKLDLRRLVYHKKSLFSGDQITKDLLDTVWESRPPPVNWKPRGILVAHLHEHRGGVNRVRVNQDHKYFATCSNDGSVKVFDSQRMEGKSVTNRSRMTYNKQDGQIKTLTFCDNSQSVAFVADKGDSCSLNVFRIEPSGSHKYTVLLNKPLDVEKDGMVVDLLYFDTGSQNILTYATVNGNIIGWDMRTSKEVWRLQNDTKQGLITSFDIHPKLSWMVLGTSSGTMTCWDMRFHLPVTSIVHPTGARVRRCIAHPTETSTIISAVQGNNEISFWDLETGSRHKTLWASTAPPLSLTQATAHSINGMYFGKTDMNTFLLAAGSDMRVRYWDLGYSANSQLITGAATDPTHNQMAVSYRSRLIDGTEVIQETYGKHKKQAEEMPRKGPDLPPTGHHDIITDISICQPSQCFMITSSRDGVVKVWK